MAEQNDLEGDLDPERHIILLEWRRQSINCCVTVSEGQSVTHYDTCLPITSADAVIDQDVGFEFNINNSINPSVQSSTNTDSVDKYYSGNKEDSKDSRSCGNKKSKGETHTIVSKLNDNQFDIKLNIYENNNNKSRYCHKDDEINSEGELNYNIKSKETKQKCTSIALEIDIDLENSNPTDTSDMPKKPKNSLQEAFEHFRKKRQVGPSFLFTSFKLTSQNSFSIKQMINQMFSTVQIILFFWIGLIIVLDHMSFYFLFLLPFACTRCNLR